MTVTHKKAYPILFAEVANGHKTFDLRLADFDCQPGDTLVLDEVSEADKVPTGRSIQRKVGFVLRTKDLEFFAPEDIQKHGFQVLSLLPDDAEGVGVVQMPKIQAWLEGFRTAWTGKDMSALASLFDTDVEYWETPYRKLDGVAAVLREWENIKTQEAIAIATDVIATVGDLSTVQWKLSYTSSGTTYNWAGLYVVRLGGKNGACDYFLQVGEAQV